MIYTPMTKKALKLAFKAHKGQKDRSGLPYILHPVHVAEQMTTEDTCVVAILHDVIEDTDYTLEDLRKKGFTEVQLRGVDLMTHREDEDYFDYIRKLCGDPVARAVKREDLLHNLDPGRLKKVTEKDELRFAKYRKALGILDEAEAKSEGEKTASDEITDI